MHINQKIITFLTSLLILSLSGCSLPQGPMEVLLMPDAPTKQGESDSVAERFREPATKGPTTVESVIELSEKYAKLSEEMTELQQKSQGLTAENQHLKDQLATSKAQLKQTQKELAEANDLLIEMRIELNNWKTDILGFRGEMRDAEKAQLEALLKILKTLGGEVKTESAQDKAKGDTDLVAKNSNLR